MPHGYTGQKTSSSKTSTGKFSQASLRYSVTAYDQHDRPWHMSVEKSNGRPVGLISPLFSAPWMPDQKYLVINPDDSRELYINYPQMYRDRNAAMQAYHRDAVQKATANSWTTPTLGQYDEKILSTIGRPPAPVEPVVAAYQENGWILGTRPTPTTAADKLLAARFVLDTRKASAAEREMATAFDFRDGASARGGDAGTATVAPNFHELEAQGLDAEVAEDFADADLEAAFGEIERSAEGAADLEALIGEDLVDAPAPDDDPLLDLEEQIDPEATGGQRVPPQHQSRPSASPRRPKSRKNRGALAEKPKGNGGRVRAFDRNRGASLAQGARPVVSE